MIFLANENFPLPSVSLIRKAGFDIISVAVDNPSVSDVTVMELAIRENRTILTFDRDYGELVFNTGIVHQQVLCISGLNIFNLNNQAKSYLN